MFEKITGRLSKLEWLTIFAITGAIQIPLYALNISLASIPFAILIYILFSVLLGFWNDYFIFNMTVFKKVKARKVFSSAKKYLVMLGSYCLQAFYLILWCLIPIVGIFIAVYKAFSYSFTNFILIDSEFDFGINDAISTSNMLSRGNKLKIVFAYLPYIVFAIAEVSVIWTIGGREIDLFMESTLYYGFEQEELKSLLAVFPPWLMPLSVVLSIFPFALSKVRLVALFKKITGQIKYQKPSINYFGNKDDGNTDVWTSEHINNPDVR